MSGALPVSSGDQMPRDALEAQLVALRGQPIRALRRAWRTIWQSDAPAVQSADLLFRLMAWRLQADHLGGLTLETQVRLALLRRQVEARTLRVASPVRAPQPGVKLVRDWQGTRHEVTVTETGYLYRDTAYTSLSEIARRITGTRWSGPRFFGTDRDSPPLHAARPTSEAPFGRKGG